MVRRLLKIFGFAVVGAVLLLAAFGVWRKDIAARAVIWQLERMGVEAPALTVERLGFDGLAVTGLRLGQFLSAARVEVARRGWDPLHWDYRAAGVRLAVSYRGDNLSIGPFDDLLGGEGSDGGAVVIPDMSVEGLELSVETDFGPATLDLPGTIRVAGGGPVRLDSAITFTHQRMKARGRMQTVASTDGLVSVSARFDEIELAAEGREIRAGDVEIAAELQPEFAELRLKGQLPGLSAAFELDLTAAAPLMHPVLEGKGSLKLDSLGPLREWLPEASLPSGALAADVSIGGELDIAALLGPDGPFGAFIGDIGFRSEGTLTGIAGVAERLEFSTASEAAVAPGGAVSVDISRADFGFTGLDSALIPAEIGPEGRAPLIGDSVTVSVPQGARVSGLDLAVLAAGGPLQGAVSGRFDIESLARLELAVGLARMDPGRLSADAVQADIRGASVDGIPIQEVQITGGGWLGEGVSFEGLLQAEAGPVALGGAKVEKVAATLPVSYRNDGNTGEARVSDAALTVSRTSTGTPMFSLPEPVQMQISGSVRTGPCGLAACSPALEAAEVVADIAALAVETEAAGRVDLKGIRARASVPSLAAERPLLDLKTDIARLVSERHGQAENLSLEGRSDFSLSRLKHRLVIERIDAMPVDGLRPPPVSLSADLTGPVSDPDINGEIALLGRPVPPVRFSANRRTARAEMADAEIVDLLELDAVGAAIPVLVERAEGRVSLLAEHDVASAITSLTLDIHEAGGIAESAIFSGFSGRFRLRSVSPLISDGVQSFRMRRLEAGVALENVETELMINEADGVIVAEVPKLAGDVFDGRFAFDPVTFSSEGELPELRLRLTDVELGAMTGLLGLEGFALEGRMDGEIPFAVDAENRVAIRGGHLTATGPGVMRLKLDEFRAMLAESMGDQADILLNALLDFHHTVLEARIDKPFDGDEKVSIRLEGSNPAHLDGHPFVFNISLESNVIQLAEPLYGLYQSTLGSVENFVRTLNEDR